MKAGFLDKLIDRLDRLDPDSLQTQFLRLAGEKGLLETILQAIHEGLVVLDGEGMVTYANRAAEKMLGFSLDSASGQPIQRYLRDIDWDLVLELDEDEWSRVVSREIEIGYPEHRFVAFYLVPLSAANAEASGAVLILRDVTREREHEESFVESERQHAITLLAAGVAHEIGNPLNSLNIHLQLIDRELEHLAGDDRENLRDLTDICRKEVTRLDQILNQFLGALRPQPPDMQPADIRGLLGDTLAFLGQEVEDRGVLIEVEIPEDLPSLSLDKGQIKQAMYNLIRNAVQAMRDGGLLKITVSPTERFVAVSFSDTGPGIEAEDLGRIFEPYHTTKKEGSGLGLMIVQRILRDHGGEIEIDSRPEHGTTVTLFLPRDDRRTRLLKAQRGTTPPEGSPT